MTLTIEEAREWFRIRDRVKQAVFRLEVCGRCWRVRDLAKLIPVRGSYCCRPGDQNGCLASRSNAE